MWWLGPVKLKRLLGVFLSHVIGPYVEAVNWDDVKEGIENGRLTLRNLRLRRDLLQRFLLPVRFVHGHLGSFTLNLSWQNLGNEPIQVEIEDVYLLVAPSSDVDTDTGEQRERARFTKLERLRLADLFCWQFQTDFGDTPLQQETVNSLIARIIGSLEVSVRNVHIRYEDTLSVPKELFAAGITLAGLTITSGQWSFGDVNSAPEELQKLIHLDSLAVYLDTNTTSLGHLSHDEFIGRNAEYISCHEPPERHFILKPVCSRGKIQVINGHCEGSPHFDIQLVVDDMVIALNGSQYHDITSLIDLYYCYLRRKRFRRYRSQDTARDETEKIGPAALWKLAAGAIMSEVRDRQRRWTWAWFAKRRDERRRYIDLWTKKEAGILDPKDVPVLEALEDELSYDDLRLYCLIARLQSSTEPNTIPAAGALSPSQSGHMHVPSSPLEALRSDKIDARVAVRLECGSLALRTDPLREHVDVLSVALGKFNFIFRQRPESRETIVTLASVAVRDGSDPNDPHPLVVYVKDSDSNHGSELPVQVSTKQPLLDKEPFFALKIESNPKDPQADSLVTVETHDLEVVYNRGYLEALNDFFKIPEAHRDSFQSFSDWLMRSSSFFRWASVAAQTVRTLFTLRVQDDSQASRTGASAFVLQLSAFIKARIVSSSDNSRVR